jgi:hypothetical protein
MSAKKKVSAVVRADDLASLRQFNDSYKPKWFYIPKGYGIRIFSNGEVYFDAYAEDIAIDSNKAILIGYTPGIVMVGLVATKSLNEFPDAIKVQDFKIRF